MTRDEIKNQNDEKVMETIKASLKLLDSWQLKMIWWTIREFIEKK